jgi:hypothetical protein
MFMLKTITKINSHKRQCILIVFPSDIFRDLPLTVATPKLRVREANMPAFQFFDFFGDSCKFIHENTSGDFAAVFHLKAEHRTNRSKSDPSFATEKCTVRFSVALMNGTGRVSFANPRGATEKELIESQKIGVAEYLSTHTFK